MNFIELTFYDGEKLFINPALIIYMTTDNEGDTKILYPGDSWVYVKETPKEIMELINKL